MWNDNWPQMCHTCCKLMWLRGNLLFSRRKSSSIRFMKEIFIRKSYLWFFRISWFLLSMLEKQNDDDCWPTDTAKVRLLKEWLLLVNQPYSFECVMGGVFFFFEKRWLWMEMCWICFFINQNENVLIDKKVEVLNILCFFSL